jgi:hypothetical protein
MLMNEMMALVVGNLSTREEGARAAAMRRDKLPPIDP